MTMYPLCSEYHISELGYKVATFAISASEDGVHKEICRIYQKLVFKAFKNRKSSVYFHRQQVRSIDRSLFFFKLDLLIFR